jgi:hypothetical protein
VKTNFILTYTEVSLYRSCHRFPCVAIYILFYFSSTVPALFLFYAAVPALFLFYAAIPAKIDYPIYSVFIAIYRGGQRAGSVGFGPKNTTRTNPRMKKCSPDRTNFQTRVRRVRIRRVAGQTDRFKRVQENKIIS